MSDKDWKRVIDELDTSNPEVLDALGGVMMGAFENSVELMKLKQDPRLSDDSATALAAVMGSTGAVVKLYAIHGKAIFKFGVEGALGRLGRFITIDTDECEILTANDINTEGE